MPTTWRTRVAEDDDGNEQDVRTMTSRVDVEKIPDPAPAVDDLLARVELLNLQIDSLSNDVVFAMGEAQRLDHELRRHAHALDALVAAVGRAPQLLRWPAVAAAIRQAEVVRGRPRPRSGIRRIDDVAALSWAVLPGPLTDAQAIFRAGFDRGHYRGPGAGFTCQPIVRRNPSGSRVLVTQFSGVDI